MNVRQTWLRDENLKSEVSSNYVVIPKGSSSKQPPGNYPGVVCFGLVLVTFMIHTCRHSYKENYGSTFRTSRF